MLQNTCGFFNKQCIFVIICNKCFCELSSFLMSLFWSCIWVNKKMENNNILNKYMHSIYIWLASVSAGSLFLFYYLLYFSCEHWILFSCLKHCKIMSRLNNILYFVLTSPGDFQFCLACAGRSWHPHSKWIRFGTINH